MFYRPSRSQASAPARRLLTLAVALSAPIAACDDDVTGPENGSAMVVGNWNVTSFEALGMDGIAKGMTVTASFTQGGMFTRVVSNDPQDPGGRPRYICPETTNCTIVGTYTATATQLTLEVDDEDDIVFSYAIQGSTMK